MKGWVGRVAVAAVLYAVLYVALRTLDFEPHAVPLLLLVLLGLLVWWLVIDALDAPPAEWNVASTSPFQPPGQDVVLSGYLRLLESHAASREPDQALRRRLLALGHARLEARLGVPPDDTTSADALGPEWAAMCRDPHRRLSVAEIDRMLTRIEEL
ncbi:hypothetical protein [Nocardioides sp. LHG3406-4]|uniref:hypothetical protein n=1 Tax=Nocardioides sp. LHG3406-4 TaxID=2804575 RepID=UPI003CF71DFE